MKHTGLLIRTKPGNAASVSQLPLSMQPECVSIRQTGWPAPPCEWQAYFEGRWRKVHAQVKRLYIVHLGKRITIQIEGV